MPNSRNIKVMSDEIQRLKDLILENSGEVVIVDVDETTRDISSELPEIYNALKNKTAPVILQYSGEIYTPVDWSFNATTGTLLTLIVQSVGKLSNHSVRIKKLTLGDSGILTASFNDESFSTGSTGGVNYSTDEVDTGITWTDGRKVYQKTITATLARGEYAAYYYHDLGDLGADILLDQESFLNISGLVIPYGSAAMTNQTVTAYTYYPRLDSGHLVIGLPQDTPAVGNSLTITVKYVKPAVNTNTRKKK